MIQPSVLTTEKKINDYNGIFLNSVFDVLNYKIKNGSLDIRYDRSKDDNIIFKRVVHLFNLDFQNDAPGSLYAACLPHPVRTCVRDETR